MNDGPPLPPIEQRTGCALAALVSVLATLTWFAVRGALASNGTGGSIAVACVMGLLTLGSVAVYLVARARQRAIIRRRRRIQNLECLGCGYSLLSAVKQAEPVCPECGRVIDADQWASLKWLGPAVAGRTGRAGCAADES